MSRVSIMLTFTLYEWMELTINPHMTNNTQSRDWNCEHINWVTTNVEANASELLENLVNKYFLVTETNECMNFIITCLKG